MIDLLTKLKALKLYGMASAWGELMAEARRQLLTSEAMLLRLLEAEHADRQAHSLSYQMKATRFPHPRDLTGFDWEESPLPAERLTALACGDYLAEARNLILVGGTGTAKTQLATALGVAAIHHGKRVRFYNVVDLVNLLEQGNRAGKAGNLSRQLTLMDAVILDELGYLPFPESGDALLFHLISQLYEKASLIVTTNLIGVCVSVRRFVVFIPIFPFHTFG